ncbi:cardiolipin synthase [Caldibacillus lycopersici]|uniref:Cardiolipin synthase n=1 Tax=Perspicuibacillus lycopersici TaxID=1325689 RepID=A0AAE3IWG2_9BACI|nr:cardiolipin synthase [Perspicuibacillus lycopersici]MCU9613335.1 cardiolipin synthase [Perspicuibacillus lycopersici]
MLVLIWIVLLLIIFVFLLFLDLYLGRKSHLRSVKTHSFPLRHSDVEIIIKGPLLFDRIFQDIERAQHHIHMLFYIFRDDSFGQELFSLLQKKAAEGVEIRILIDWLGSIGFPRKVIKDLKRKGIDIAFGHTPSFPYLFYKVQSRNHRKITIIDGQIGYLGGFNVGKEYVDKDPKLSPWRDCHVRITGEGVEDLQLQFLTDWTEATKRPPEHADQLYPPLQKGRIQHQFVSFEGVGLEDKVCQLLQNAKKKVIIGSPYFIPGKKAFTALKQTIKRGVEVTLIVPKVSDHLLIKEASYRYLRKLLSLGCVIYQYREGFYHAKVFIIDDETCSIGTANFDKRSFYFNHEMNSIFYDSEMVDHMLKIAHLDISKSSRLHKEALNKPNAFEKVKEWIALLVSPFL